MQKFIEAICQTGLTPPPSIVIDGKIKRFSSNGSKKDKAGYYSLYNNGNNFIAGYFGCWRSGIYQTWSNISRSELNNDRMWDEYQQAIIASRRKAEEERQLEAQKAAKKAEKIWNNASHGTEDHPYLKKKGVKSYGLRVDEKNNLLIPVIDFDKNMHSLQQIPIDLNQRKHFLSDGIISGHFFLIPGRDEVIYIAEGYATAASIHEATQSTIYMAFFAGNLIKVAQKVREKNPEVKLVIAADNDTLTDGNPGLTQAKEAARITRSYIACPKFEVETDGGKFSDFNDMHALYGLIAVRSCLQEAVQLESDKELSSEEQEERKKKKTQGEELLELAKNLYLFKNLNDTIFADIPLKHTLKLGRFAIRLLDNG